MGRVLTVALLGAGSRGRIYTDIMYENPERFKVVSVCDLIPQMADNRRVERGLDPAEVFYDEDAFFAKRRADMIVIATQDRDHVDHAIRAMELGYDILMEKPISDRASECRRLLAAQKKYGKRILVCHVLRYAPAFCKIKEILDSGVLGQLVMIDSIEQVLFCHQAHSFVRGNWRNSDTTSPMIVQKCCHDMDLLQWYAGSRCESISSIGDLRFFKPENQPEGAADRCVECKYAQECPYSAVRIYRLEGGMWSCKHLTDVRPLTQEAVDRGVQEGPYGRCVFKCDNNVVDNQIVVMRFENGVTANLRMTAFTGGQGREMKLYCTYGELQLDQDAGYISVRVFGKPEERISISGLVSGGYAHGGGDQGLVGRLYDMIVGNAENETSLEASIESHLMAFAAEESRLQGGKFLPIQR